MYEAGRICYFEMQVVLAQGNTIVSLQEEEKEEEEEEEEEEEGHEVFSVIFRCNTHSKLGVGASFTHQRLSLTSAVSLPVRGSDTCILNRESVRICTVFLLWPEEGVARWSVAVGGFGPGSV
jgi:hypothetical protein